MSTASPSIFPFISIVIANYNGEDYLETCLTSLLLSSIKRFEVIVIDNCSTDSSLEIVRSFQKKDSRIKLLKNSVNIGVPASRNKAISCCKGDIIVFLDNDTELQKRSLELLIQPVLRHKDVGASQALLLDFEDRRYVQMAGGHLIPQVIWLMGFYERSEYKKVKHRLCESNIIAISAALAVKREVLDAIGGYDGLLQNYTDDLDLSWRVWIAGYRVVLAYKSIVFHYTKSVDRRTNVGSNKFDIYFHMAKNSFRSIIKNYQFNNMIWYLSVSVCLNLGRGVLVFIRRGDISAFVATVAGIVWIIRNLGGTLRCRNAVQSTRKFTDERILGEVFVKHGLLDTYNKKYRYSKLLW